MNVQLWGSLKSSGFLRDGFGFMFLGVEGAWAGYVRMFERVEGLMMGRS